MITTRIGSGVAWNKGLVVGQKRAFSLKDIAQVEAHLLQAQSWHDPQDYSSHSVRRSKPAHMYWAGEDIALISRLLGHKSIASTIEYLGITQAKAETAALRHPMM